jgi:hypothetical protein
MRLLIRTSNFAQGGIGDVRLIVSPDWSVAELIAEVRSRMPLPLQKLLNNTEQAGSTIFLTKQPNGPLILEKNALLRDCDVTDESELWLKAGHFRQAI